MSDFGLEISMEFYMKLFSTEFKGVFRNLSIIDDAAF